MVPLGQLVRSFGYAGLRSLSRAPSFSAFFAGVVALGIAGTVVILAIVDGVLLKPFSFDSEDRVVVLSQGVRAKGKVLSDLPVSAGYFSQWQNLTRSAEDVALFRWASTYIHTHA